MKLLLCLVLLALTGSAVQGGEGGGGTPFFIAGNDGIYRDSINPDTGKLGQVTLACAAQGPNFLASSPVAQILYATLGAGERSLADFQIRPDGSLHLLEAIRSGGTGACHVSVDRDGTNVLVANYDSGSIASFKIHPDGTLGEPAFQARFTGSGPDPNRQKKPWAHSIYTDPGDAFIYACDLGTDSVWIFKFDRTTGRAMPDDPPAAKVPPGSGPRHLAFHPNGKSLYVANEMGHSVTVFARDTASGGLTALQTVSALLPETPVAGVTTAEIACHPTGQWLYVSNRGCDTISVFSIAQDGKLTLIQSASSVAQFPRGFAIDPSGRWLITAGQKDNRIAVLKIDPGTGRLTATDQFASMPGPVCVVFPGAGQPSRQEPIRD